MEKKLLRQLIMLSKRLMYAFLIQLFMCTVLFANTGNAQRKTIEEVRVSVDLRDKTLLQFFRQVEAKTDFKFTYNDDMVDLGQKVTVEEKDRSLYQVLEAVSRQVDLHFVQVNENIHVKAITGDKKQTVEIAQAVDVTITGTVTDTNGEPIPGVTVSLPGTTIGTATDLDGRYSLTVPEGSTLVFSFIGYETQSIAIGERGVIDVVLNEDMTSLDEVVVVGYGTQFTREITGSVENVSTEDLEDAPVAQIGQMLQGKLTGVRINQTTGRPGEGMKFQIRGSASITAGADPLYVVDGMPISGDISNLNPTEIENISVLKDAAATSLYGSRGANGVVLIQTKTAKPGRTLIDFNAFFGYDRIPQNRRVNMMNASQYAQFQKEIAELNNRPVDPVFENPEQYGKGTDWYDEITRTGSVQSYNLTVRTGMEKFSTSVMAGYFQQEGVILGTGYERISLRANTRFQPNKKLTIGFNIAPNFSNNTNFNSDGGPYSSENIVSATLITTPLASPYNPDGSLALTASDPATFGNPNWLRVAKEKVYESENLQLLSNAFIEYEILKGFIAKTTANIQTSNSKLFQFNPSTIGVLFNPPPRIPSGSENINSFRNMVNENTLTYKKEFGEHNIDLLAGFTVQHFRGEGTGVHGTNYADDKVQVISAAGQISVTNSVQEWSLLSSLARLNYNYKGKYLFSASFRRDGSSRFGIDNRWGNFPSASVGWIVSEEDFWNMESISFLKLRASYGVTGNFEIGNYSYRSTVGAANYAFSNSPFLGRAINNLGDQGLGWERNQQLNIGLDLFLLKDRIQLTYNYYSKRTSDLLYNVNVPSSSGFNNLQTNIGELKFWGNEIGINTFNISTNNLSWNTNFNISFDRNKTVSLATTESFLAHGVNLYDIYSHRTEIGQPIAMFYGAIQDGVYINQQDFDNSPKHASSNIGTIKFRDLNDDGIITFPEDMTLIGNPWPDFTFGMTNNVNYKNFDIAFSIASSYGNQILTHHENWTTNLDGVFNVLEEVKDRWKSPEDPGKGKYGSTEQGLTFLERDTWHTRYLKDGSYLSFKNITLGYTLPLNPGKTIGNLRVYGSIQNAFIITNYPGPNPEVNTQNTSGGSTPGFDSNSYPIPRTVSLGVNFSF